MENSIPTYSIIIPHKNTYALLERCLDSIPSREDFQIIVVDDDSDIPESVWKVFPEKYGHVELYLTKEGRGAGYARNIGLGHARGEWVLFADADDFFYEDAFSILDCYSKSFHDLLFFICDSRDSDSMALIGDRMPSIRRNIMRKNIDGLRYRSIVPWGKMIRRSLIESSCLSFEETEVSNDVMFSIKLGVAAENPDVIVSTPLYCCTKSEGSLSQKKTVKRTITRVKVAKRANDYLHDQGLDKYRIPINHIGSFLPWHPVLFLWGVWMFRYKGDALGYLSDLVKTLENRIFKRFRLYE